MLLLDDTTSATIGEIYGGGFFAGTIRIGDHTYGLVVAPKHTGETAGTWGPDDLIDGATSFCDGLANTTAMSEAGSDVASWARRLDISGHTDWYIPSRDELEACYRNLKPTDDKNACWAGDNPSTGSYAYTLDIPAQTRLAHFQAGGSHAFDDAAYWTSTQYAGGASCAWDQFFDSGCQYYYGKGYKGRVRAVRRFLID